jgi:hypothetical protein
MLPRIKNCKRTIPGKGCEALALVQTYFHKGVKPLS